jgi:DNA-binding CsgD family transcriptional regulator
MSEQSARHVTFFSIEPMTVELFEFWLDRDWETIAKDIHILPRSAKVSEIQSPFLRSRLVFWSADSPKKFTRITHIGWIQSWSDAVRVEFTLDGVLSDNLAAWARHRFKVTVLTEGTPEVPPQAIAELTRTEKKVAGYLAQKLSYVEIAKRLGDKSESVARKHVQSIANKWMGKNRPIEDLWIEAEKYGFKAV